MKTKFHLSVVVTYVLICIGCLARSYASSTQFFLNPYEWSLSKNSTIPTVSSLCDTVPLRGIDRKRESSVAFRMYGTSIRSVQEANPPIQGSCPQNVILVLDESGSIVDESIANVIRSSVVDFLLEIKDKGTHISIVEFNSTARISVISEEVTSASIDFGGSLYNYLYGGIGGGSSASHYDPEDNPFRSAFTNYEDAFEKARDLNNTLPEYAEMLLFFTDGEPTKRNTPEGCTCSDADLFHAIDEVDDIKHQGTHITALGFAEVPKTESNFQALVGPEKYDEAARNFATSDYLLSSEVSDLPATFRQVALELCGIDLELQKRFYNSQTYVGEGIFFELRVTNVGNNEATNIEVKEYLPSGLSYKGYSTDPTHFDQSSGIWTIKKLEPGRFAIINIFVKVERLGEIENCVQIVSADQKDVDSTPGNGFDENEDDTACAKIQSCSLILPTCEVLPAISCIEAEGKTYHDYPEIQSSNPEGGCFIASTAVPVSIERTSSCYPGSFTVVYQVTDSRGFNHDYLRCTQVVEGPELNILPIPLELRGLESGDAFDVQCQSMDPDWEVPTYSGDDVQVRDACNTGVQVYYYSTLESDGNCKLDGYKKVYRLSWEAFDNCGNSNEFHLFMRIVDDIPPVISGVKDVTVSCLTEVNLDAVIATDECQCAELTYEDSELNPGCLDGQEVIRTYTATDCCGNMSQAQQVITLEDKVGPRITMADPHILAFSDGEVSRYNCSELSLPQFYEELSNTSVNAMDYCGEVSHIDFEVIPEESLDCYNDGYLEKYQYRWRAYDLCGNMTELSIYAEIYDDSKPEIDPLSSICVKDRKDIPLPSAIDWCSTVEFNYADEEYEDECGRTYIRRTWDAIDQCGNLTSKEQDIYLGDESTLELSFIDPNITGLPDGEMLVKSCSESTDKSMTGLSDAAVSVAGTCTEGLALSMSEEIVSGFKCEDGIMTALVEVTWTAQNECGTESKLSLMVELVDENIPTLLNFEPSAEMTCSELDEPLELGNYCGSVTVSEKRSPEVPGSCPVLFTFERNIKLSDECGNDYFYNQKVRVVDSEGPQFTDMESSICDADATEIKAYDDCMGAYVPVSVKEEQLDGCNEGVIKRTYQASDECGNISEAVQYIIGDDETPPSYTLRDKVINDLVANEKSTVYYSEYAMMKYLDRIDHTYVLAEDGCDPNVRTYFDVKVDKSRSCDVDGYSERRHYLWILSDACGNETTVEFDVDLMDDLRPKVISRPQNEVVYCTNSPNLGRPIFSDDSEFTVSYSESNVGNILKRRWIARDICGNTRKVTQIVNFVNNVGLTSEIIPTSPTYCNSHQNRFESGVSGGSAPYTYEWRALSGLCFIQGATDLPYVDVFVGFSDVELQLRITDANGCESVSTFDIDCIDPNDTPIFTFNEKDETNDDEITESPSLEHETDISTEKVAFSDVRAYPNPVSDRLSLSLVSEEEAKASYIVYDALGQAKTRMDIDIFKGENVYRIATDMLPSGNYYIRIESKKGSKILPFIKIGE